MAFPSAVERWRAMAQEEIARQGVPFPVELVLSVIRKESGGQTGIQSHKGASGLMQVMPGTLAEYNKYHTTKYDISDLRAKTQAAASIQIRVGIWVLKTYWQSAWRYLKDRLPQITIETLSKIASIFYVAGPGAGRKKLDKISKPTYDELAAKYPNWDPVAAGYALKIWNWTTEAGARWDPKAVDTWLGGGITDDTDTDTNNSTDDRISGALLAIIMMAAAWLILKGKK